MEKQEFLQVFSAGVGKKAISDCAVKWNKKHPELPVKLSSCGSVDLARRIMAGEKCDVFLSADESIMTGILLPEYVKSYTVFAGNRIVLQDMSGRGITDKNWKEKLLEPDAVFKNKDPYGDPGGYRGVMALLLADKYENGLSRKLMEHPGHRGMDPEPAPENAPEPDYLLTYYSMAASAGAQFAELPDIMNLSKEELNDEDAQVSFAVDSRHTVRGSAISHCISVPEAAEHREAAEEFIEDFLKTDFSAYFLTRKYRQVTV